MTPRILVAGIGNIFHGDDAFGCEVAQRLASRGVPESVHVQDFGIRSFDLAFAMIDDYDATIMIDATPRGDTPGTLYLIKPEMDELEQLGGTAIEGHSMNPVKVLQLVKTYGGQPNRLFLVGCEPATLESEDGRFGLSEPVEAAVDGAMEMVESLIEELFVESRGTTEDQETHA